MNKAELALTDKYLSHQIDLLRFTAGEQNKILALLKQMQVELKAKLRNGLTDFSKARVNKVLKEATGVIDGYYKTMAPVQVFRGGQALDLSKVTEKGISVTTSKDITSRFVKLRGGGVQDFYITKDAKILTDIPAKFIKFGATNTAPQGGEYLAKNALVAYARKNGYDAIDMTRFGEYEIRILNPAVLKANPKTIPKSTDMLALAQNEAQFTANIFAGIGLDAALPSEAVLKALVNGSLIEGHISADWWTAQSDSLKFKYSGQVRQGIAQSETLQKIVRRVFGSERLGTPGIGFPSDTLRRNAFTLVHNSVMQVANDSRLATFKANDDIVKGMRQLSTMDSHTSLICVTYSGAEWDLDGNPINGNTLPYNSGCPRHWGCRSLIVPITLSYKELGIDVDKPKGTRASDLGQIPSDTTFDGFLKRHDAAYADDLLGPGRAKLWRDGKITLNDLVSQTGRPLTLKQLRGKL